MAFSSLAATFVIDTLDYIKSSSELTALDFGNQRCHVSSKVYEYAERKLAPNFNLNKIFRLKDTQTGKNIPFPRNQDQIISFKTSDFIKGLGFKKYLAIDVNQTFNSIIMDLNKICLVEYDFNKTFDLVMNTGTSEHVFNQAAVFENMHNMTKLGGVMLNVLPLGPWVNHGFYNYNPRFFRDLVQANGYKWCFIRLGESRSAQYKDYEIRGDIWRNDLAKDLSKMQKIWGNILIGAAYLKINDLPFKTPFQGEYIASIDREKGGKHFLEYG